MWPWLPAPGMRLCLSSELLTHFISCSGADDDGSGSVTILESYRALISSNFRPERSVEFHWYSAEVRLWDAMSL